MSELLSSATFFFNFRWPKADIGSQTLCHSLGQLFKDLSTINVFRHPKTSPNFNQFFRYPKTSSNFCIFFGTRRLHKILVDFSAPEDFIKIDLHFSAPEHLTKFWWLHQISIDFFGTPENLNCTDLLQSTMVYTVFLL